MIRVFPVIVYLVVFITGCQQSLPPLNPLTEDAVILAFGDSLTAGTGAAAGDDYPTQLQQLILRSVVNAGQPGETSAQGVKRLPALLERHAPDLVILCHGGNDMLRRSGESTLKTNLTTMVEAIHAAGADILLIGVPQATVLLKESPVYTEIAQAYQLPLDDEILRTILRTPSFKSDQVHPNAAGYKALARRIADLLHETGAL